MKRIVPSRPLRHAKRRTAGGGITACRGGAICGVRRHHVHRRIPSAVLRLPRVEIFPEWIRAALEWIRIARFSRRVVLCAVHRCVACLRVRLGKQPLHGLRHLRERGVAVIEVAIGERLVHSLVQRVDVLGAVVPHRLEVRVLQNVERLQKRRALRPLLQLENVHAAVVHGERLLDHDLPAREVLKRDEPALLLGGAHELPRNVALVEAVVGGIDRLLPAPPLSERLLLGFHQLPQRRGKVGLPEQLARLWRFAGLARVGKKQRPRVLPLLDECLVALDGVRRLVLHRIPVGHLDRRGQHVLERHGPVFGQHRQQSARRAGCDCRECTGGGWVIHLPALEELARCARRSHSERVDADDFLRVGIINQRLRLAAP